MTTSPPPFTANTGHMPRLRVLEVVGNAIVGGMENWVERLLQRLPRERFDVTVLCPFDSPFTTRLRALGLDVFIAPMPDEPPWSTVQMASAIVTSRSIQLLHAHLPKAHLLASLVGRLTGVPVVVTVHARHLTALDLELHRLAGSHISVVCQPAYFHALGLGVDVSKLSCEPNGVDTDAFRPRLHCADVVLQHDRPDAPAGLRSALGLSDDVPLVGFVGRLSPEKGPEVFVAALLLLQARCPTAHAVLVGDGAMRAELQAQALRLGLAGQVHFAGVRSDMPAVYNALDVLVSCSHSEAMPLALMEAMASGVANVATYVGGVPDIVEHGHSGWLVAPGDVNDIAARVADLLEDPAARARMAAQARQRAVRQLSLDDSVARVAQLLTSLGQATGTAAAANQSAHAAPALHSSATDAARRPLAAPPGLGTILARTSASHEPKASDAHPTPHPRPSAAADR